jgi:hypothetical protein
MTLPHSIPNLDEVCSFSNLLHAAGKGWQGEIFDWNAEYIPERLRKPVDSKMTFTPAEFWIGESGIWFLSRMWEEGKDKEPIEFLDDWGIVK